MTRSYNSVNKKKDFVQQFFDSFEGHFTHALCRRTGSINVFLHAIGSRGVGRIRDCNASPQRCFGFVCCMIFDPCLSMPTGYN